MLILSWRENIFYVVPALYKGEPFLYSNDNTIYTCTYERVVEM